MKKSREQRKAELEKAAAEMIEALLDWEEANKAPNLRQIEDEVLKLRRQFGRELALGVLEDQEQRQPVENPECPRCGEPMRTKGRKRKGVESRLGTLEVERAYYYCAHCQCGLFPPGRTT